MDQLNGKRERPSSRKKVRINKKRVAGAFIVLISIIALMIAIINSIITYFTAKEEPKQSSIGGFTKIAPGKIFYVKDDKLYAIKTSGKVVLKKKLFGLSNKNVIQSVLVSGDGRKLAYNYGSRPSSKNKEINLAIINIGDGKPLINISKESDTKEKTSELNRAPVIASDLAWSPDNNSIILLENLRALILDINTGKTIDTGIVVTNEISWSPDGGYLVSSGNINKSFTLYDVGLKTITYPPSNDGRKFQFRNDNQLVFVTGGVDATSQKMSWNIYQCDLKGESLNFLTNILISDKDLEEPQPPYEMLRRAHLSDRLMFVCGGGLCKDFYIYTIHLNGRCLPNLVAQLKRSTNDDEPLSKKRTWFKRAIFLSPDGDWIAYTEKDGLYAIQIENKKRIRIAKGNNIMLAGWAEE